MHSRSLKLTARVLSLLFESDRDYILARDKKWCGVTKNETVGLVAIL